MVELVGPRPEAADPEVVVRVLDLLHRAGDVVERHRARRDHDAVRRLAHLLAPPVVGARHRGLELGVDPFEPHVVLGAVDHHHVDAFGRERGGDAVAGEALHRDVAVLGHHVVGGPVDRLLELAVDRRRVLREATVDGDRVVVVEARRGCAGHAVAVPLVEEPRPEIGRVDHVGVGVEDLVSAPHRGQYSRPAQARG